MAEHRRGEKNFPTPQKTHHIANFEAALEDALNQWKQGDPTNVDVVLQATVSPNPGGVSQYRAIVTQQTKEYPKN